MNVFYSLTVELIEEFLLAVEAHTNSFIGHKMPICDPGLEFFVGSVKIEPCFKSQELFHSRKRAHIPTLNKLKRLTTDNSSSLGSFREAEIVNSFQELTATTGRKVFLCEVCNFKANSKAAVKRHVWITHSVNCPRSKVSCNYHSILVSTKAKLRSFVHYYQQAHLRNFPLSHLNFS